MSNNVYYDKSNIGLKIFEFSITTSLLFLTSIIVILVITGDIEETFGLVITKLKLQYYRVYYYASSLF